MKILKDKTYDALVLKSEAYDKATVLFEKWKNEKIELKKQIADLKFEISNPPKYEVGKTYGKFKIIQRNIKRKSIFNIGLDIFFKGVNNTDFSLTPYWLYEIEKVSKSSEKFKDLLTETELEKLLNDQCCDLLTKKSAQVRKKIEKLDKEQAKNKLCTKFEKCDNYFKAKKTCYEKNNESCFSDTTTEEKAILKLDAIESLEKQIKNKENLLVKYRNIINNPTTSSGNKQYYTKKLNKALIKIVELENQIKELKSLK